MTSVTQHRPGAGSSVAFTPVLLRVSWRSVSDIVTRVEAVRAGQLDCLAGLRRIRSRSFLLQGPTAPS